MTQDEKNDTTQLQILRRPEVEERIGLRRSALYQAIQDGRFPRPVKLTPHAVGWLANEIDDWIAARSAERDANTEAGT